VNNTLYVNVNDCNKLSDEEIKEQIRLREYLINTMIGSLYPQVVGSDIEKLEDIIKKRKYKKSWDGMWEIE